MAEITIAPVQTVAPSGDPAKAPDPIIEILSAGDRARTAAPENPDKATTDGNPVSPAPANGQPQDGTQKKPDAKPDGSTAKDGKEDEATLSQDEIDQAAREALGVAPKEPNNAEHWKKQYSASSTQAKTLAQRVERFEALLKELGLKVFDSGDKAELVADDQYVAAKSESLAKDISSKLTREERDLALDDPEKFAHQIAEKILKATARPQPTISASDIKIAESAKSLVRGELIAAKGTDGTPELPDFESLEPYINNLRDDDKATPEGFKKFMESSEANYRYGMKLLYARVHQRVAPIIARELDKKAKLVAKQKAAKEDVSLTSEGTRTGQTRKVDRPDDAALAVATAKSQW